MSKKLLFINKIYTNNDYHDDILHDSIVIFSRNITSGFMMHKKRNLTSNDVDAIIRKLKEELFLENDIGIDWDQTS